jgi:LruC domain-containing protein
MKKSTMMLLTLMSVMMFSCKDKDLYDPNAVKPGEEQKVANTFDFSTVQDVMLTVDYSAFNTHGPVFFSIYHENPFVGEGEDEHLDENIKPIYEDYTDKSGRFNQTVELPAYAKHLYVVTGNFFVTERLMETDVQNGGAKATAKSAGTRAASRAVTRRGAQTNDVSKMPQLSFNVDGNGNKIGERVYQDWLTPLGTWDDRSGAPSYLIDKSKVDQELIFSDEDMEGLYATVSQVLNANKACRKTYRDHEDLVLDKASEVTITMLGGSTCWNSSLGYYYYEVGKEPTDTKDLNIIMLFPNTQDGNWTRFDSRKNDYNGNIGVNRGDAIQLMYYPNIADGDLSVVSNVFPANTKIGFILKSHGWGMQGEDYVIKGFAENDRKYNVWGASTPGLSYCKVPAGFENKKSPYQYPNPDGDSRSAKFAYKTVDGGKYAIVSFEDACNDEDYDDVIFALKPIDAFKPLPEIESDRVVTEGVYAFEDLWPAQGDYDMNDVVVDFKHEREMTRNNTNENFKTIYQTFYLTTYQNYVTLVSGLALKLNTKKKPTSIVMKKIASGSDDEETVTFENDGSIYYLTNDVKAELGTTYILELFYKDGVGNNDLASVEPFIFRKEANDQEWEVHIPYEAPTAKMDFSYFGKGDDASKVNDNIFFVRSGNYPFAFYLAGVNIDAFKDTILLRANESKMIDKLYPDFLDWSLSKGTEKPQWYLSPAR